MTTNYGRSIRDRLLNLAKSEGQDYMKVLVRYLHERLLYRISVSEYKSHFLLKEAPCFMPSTCLGLGLQSTLTCWVKV